jgi:hypothetical protein
MPTSYDRLECKIPRMSGELALVSIMNRSSYTMLLSNVGIWPSNRPFQEHSPLSKRRRYETECQHLHIT